THPASYGPGLTWFKPEKRRIKRGKKRDKPAETIAVVRMRLLGSNPTSTGAVSWSGTKAKEALGRESEVRYRDVYPGIDVIYHSDLHRLKYDFVLTSAADLNLIRLRFTGTDGIRSDKDGTLLLRVPGG